MNPFISSPLLSSYRLNPFLFSKRQRYLKLSQWHFSRITKPRFFAGISAWLQGIFTFLRLYFCDSGIMVSWCIAVAAAENDMLPKTFDFTSEERIYNWYFILFLLVD